MRRRLLATTLATAVAAVLLLGLPLVVAFQVVVTRRALDTLERQATSVQAALNTVGSPAVRSALLGDVAARTELHLVLYDAVGGDLLVATDTDPAVPAPAFAEVEAALQRSATVRMRADGELMVIVPLRAGGVSQALAATVSDDDLAAQIVQGRVAVAGLALVAVGVAAVVAVWQARALGMPLEALAASARRLGDGDFSARAPRSGIAEPDAVAEALDATAVRLAAMLERSRSFSADASHQLRTPLTALRLNLEALAAGPAAPELVAAATAEADRLERTIDELLLLAGAPSGDEHADLATLVEERTLSWEQLAAAHGRRLRVDAEAVPPVMAREAAIGQALQVLLDNALVHGAGTVTVTVTEVTGGVRVAVHDEGEGLPADVFAGGAGSRRDGGGRGLPLARSLVEAEGGRLVLEPDSGGATVCLLLPTSPLPTARVRETAR